MKLKLQFFCLLLTINLFSQSNLLNSITVADLFNENFGSGSNTTAAGIASQLCFNDQVSGTCPNSSLMLNENQYVVTKAISPNNATWFNFRDHTSGGSDLNGRFLAINIGSAVGPNGILFSQKLFNIVPDQPIIVEIYVANLISPSFSSLSDPSLLFEIQTSSGVSLDQFSIGSIPKSNSWLFQKVTLNFGNNLTTPYLNFNIRSESIRIYGNDLVIDDIRVYQEPLLNANKSLFDQVIIYPNPVNDELNIDNVVLEKILIYDIFGQLVLTKNFSIDSKNNIDLKTFSKGVYFLKLFSEGLSTTKKIIIE